MMAFHLVKPSRIFFNILRRSIHSKRLVLGIESTFDDTAAAVVNEDGVILGESSRSQLTEHKSAGGVDQVFAKKLHEDYLPSVVDQAMLNAAVTFKDLSALATATRPGLAFSLEAGLDFSKNLISKHGLSFIPVHHMEAHALTVRMIEKVEFPFLVLLASGGHCLLCLAQGLGDYKILGQALDEPPGAVFDKIAREMGLLTEDEFFKISGGQAIEILAEKGDESKYKFTVPLNQGHNCHTCNFSFCGLQTQVKYTIQRLRKNGELDDQARCDIAAGFQRTIVQHILNSIKRGILFCQAHNLLDKEPVLVLSGGVASNYYFRENIYSLCESLDFRLLCPPKHLCVDNGIMIAWAGMECLKQGIGIAENPFDVRYEPKSPIGQYIGNEVTHSCIYMKRHIAKKRGVG